MHAAGVVEQSGVAAEAEAVEAGQDREQQRAQACEESFHGVLLGIKPLVEHPLYPSARLSGSVGLWAQPTLSARLGQTRKSFSADTMFEGQLLAIFIHGPKGEDL